MLRCFSLISSLLLCFTNAKAQNYLDYYRAIALAEEMAVNGKHTDALNKYEETFYQYPYNNPIDCYVAAQLAAYVADTAKCISLLGRGLSFGLPITTIRNNPHLIGFVQANNHHGLSTAAIDSCWGVYQSRINKEARAIAIHLAQKDQALVRSLPMEGLYQGNGRELKPIYRSFFDSLLADVVAVTKQYGFPAQKVVGTLNGDDSLFSVGPNSVFAYFIMIHHCNAWPQVGDMLWSELKKGNITPQMYGAIFDHSNNNISEDKCFVATRPCDTKPCKLHVKNQLEELNAQRYKIGLCSYQIMEQKFASSLAFYKWRKNGSSSPKPLFDFQPDLHFRQ